jgi:dsRNA-specific ribonuclease
MATTVEAILGAVYLDSGTDALNAVLVTLGLTHQFLEAVTFILLPLLHDIVI